MDCPEIDTLGIRASIEQVSEYLHLGFRAGLDSGFLARSFDAIVFVGMGGSGIGGRLLASLLAARSEKPVFAVSHPVLPSWVRRDTLVVLSTYSGSTAETLACAEQAASRGAQMLVVSAGNPLSAISGGVQAKQVRIPGGLMPRCALGLMFGGIVGALAHTGIVERDLIDQAIAGTASVDLSAARAHGERLSAAVPVIYGAGPLAVAAYRWKAQLNENAKQSAFAGEIPEALHNEIETYTGAGSSSLVPVFLRSDGDGEYLESRYAALTQSLTGAGYCPIDIRAAGSSDVGAVFELITLGDWVSFYAAQGRGVDPGPIPIISRVKDFQ